MLSGDVATQVHRLKSQPGRDLALVVGGAVVRAFINLDLIDDPRAFTRHALDDQHERVFGNEPWRGIMIGWIRPRADEVCR